MATIDGGEVEVVVSAKDDVSKGLGSATKSLRTFEDRAASTGKKMQKAGTAMTLGLTLPLVGVGIGAFKAASDFDTSMRQIQSLVGATGEEVEGFKEDVLKLSGETARAPKELADAMFFITSAGLKGAAAVDALEISAKAAAVGMGSTEVIADALTNAINGYGQANLSAAEAGDILAKTVELGKASAAQMAPTLGRLIPIAAEIGVGFDEVGAGMALLTRSSGNAAMSATQLGAVFRTVLAPTMGAKDALDAIGMSVGDLRTGIESDFLGTLDGLRTKLGDAGLEMSDVFESSEALSAVLQLTGDSAATARGVFDQMGTSTGKLDSAFKTTTEGPGFKMQEAMATISATMVTIGDSVIPAVLPWIVKIGEAVGAAAEFFGGLTGTMQGMVIALGAVLAAAGPVTGAIGGVAAAAPKLVTAVAGLGPAGVAAGAALGLVAVGVLAVRNASQKFQAKVELAKDELIKFNPELNTAVTALQEMADAMPAPTSAMEELAAAVGTFAGEAMIIDDAVSNGLGPALQTLMDAGVDLETVMDNDRGALQRLLAQMNDGEVTVGMFDELTKDMTASGKLAADAFMEMHVAEDANLSKLGELVDMLGDTGVKLEAAERQLKNEAKAFMESEDATALMTKSLHLGGAELLAYKQLLADAGDGADDYRVSAVMLQERLATVEQAQNFVNAEFLQAVPAQGAAAGAADEAAAAILGEEAAIDELIKSVSELTDLLFGAADAEYAMELASKAAGKAIDEAGGDLDGMSKKSQAARDAVRDSITAMDDLALSMVAAGEPAAATARAFLANRDALLDQAIGAGASAEEIRELKSSLDAVQGTYTANLQYNIAIHEAITETRYKGIGAGDIGSMGGNPFTDPVMPMADGGLVRRPTFALIGEAGPEVVIPLDRLPNLGESGGGGFAMPGGGLAGSGNDRPTLNITNNNYSLDPNLASADMAWAAPNGEHGVGGL